MEKTICLAVSPSTKATDWADAPVQLDLFTDYEAEAREEKEERNASAKERRLQEAALKIKKEFGKNARLRGLNYAEGATQKERNNQIGGHKA